MLDQYEIYCDGSPSKLAIIINDTSYIKDSTMPHNRPVEIEYAALSYALSLLPDGVSATIRSDNQTVVARMNSDYTVNPAKENELFNIYQTIHNKKLHIQVRWIPRKRNKAGKLI